MDTAHESAAFDDAGRDSLPVAIQTLDGDGRILSVNAAWRRLTGLDADAARGMRFADLAAPDDRDRALRRLEGVRGGRGDEAIELELVRADEARVRVVLTEAPERDADGRTVRIVGVLHDVTERRRAEAALVNSERLAAVGRLAAGVAHQFNNLNAPILGFADLILREDGLAPELRRRLELIRTASERARDITDNLLAFAELRKPVLAHHHDLRAIVRRVLAECGEEIAGDEIDLETDLGETPPTPMDDVEVARALQNLLSNARHAVLEQRRRRIRVKTGFDGMHVFARIEDSGCGIPEEDMPRLFTPFFSAKGEFAAPSSPQARVRGVGLGLSVSLSIARHHGGDLTVDPHLAEGAAFTLRLPLVGAERPGAPAPARDKAPGAAAATGASRERVLVVDDDEMTRTVVGEILGGVGYTVESAADGAVALLRAQETNFDVVLADLQMPGMHGAEFLHLLYRAPLTRMPAVIVLTGKATAENVQAYADLPVFATLRKPCAPEDLIQCVERAIERFRASGPG